MTPDSLFSGLSAAMVEDVLTACGLAAADALAPVRALMTRRDDIRRDLVDRSLIRQVGDAGYTPPDVCGVAAVSAQFPLFGAEACMAAACAVEGLVPAGAAPRWDAPRHTVLVPPGSGNGAPPDVLDAVSAALMLARAQDAPHTLTLIDAPLAGPFFAITDALRPALKAKDTPVGKEYVQRLMPSMAAMAALVVPGGKARLTAGMPAHPVGAEFARTHDIDAPLDDAAFLTVVLEPGEYTAPVPVDAAGLDRARSLPVQDEAFVALAASIVASLETARVIHIRPRAWTPALRVELPGYLADRDDVLALVVRGIAHQCSTPGSARPYPLYRAEGMCARLAAACPAVASRADATADGAAGPVPDILSLFATR